MYDMEWYGFGVATILGFVVVLWTEIAQMVCKNRVFYWFFTSNRFTEWY